MMPLFCRLKKFSYSSHSCVLIVNPYSDNSLNSTGDTGYRYCYFIRVSPGVFLVVVSYRWFLCRSSFYFKFHVWWSVSRNWTDGFYTSKTKFSFHSFFLCVCHSKFNRRTSVFLSHINFTFAVQINLFYQQPERHSLNNHRHLHLHCQQDKCTNG